MRIVFIAIGFLALVGIVVGSNVFFTVHQTKQALVLQLGDPKRVINEAGLYLKLPFIQNVVEIDKRILGFDSPTQELIAKDRKRLVVDAFTRYRIVNALQFYKSLRDSQRAESRLAAIVSSSMRSVVGEATFGDVVRDKREELMSRIKHLVNQQTKDFGIEVVDVRIRRADLPEANSQAIYRRMQTERQQEAAEFRAKGQEVSRSIHAQADKNVTVLLAEATRDAEILRGQGDGCRNRIFAIAYGQDPDFFAFYRAMQSYDYALGETGTTLVLSPKSAFFKYLNNPNAVLNEKNDFRNSGAIKSKINFSKIIAKGKSLRKVLCGDMIKEKLK